MESEEIFFKKKRGRPKKTLLPEEIQKLIEEVKEKEDLELKDIIQEVKELYKGEWDVKKDDRIEYFDINLSYELTGYKPINETKGLDFNPSKFLVVRENKIRTGHYTQFRKGTKAYADFWNEEYKKCMNGCTIDGYTITGPNYYYLNYYLLPNIEVDKAGSGRAAIFPNFLVFLYEFFHYFEICRILKKDCVLMKARGIGQQTKTSF